jgi:hypothetical protein
MVLCCFAVYALGGVLPTPLSRRGYTLVAKRTHGLTPLLARATYLLTHKHTPFDLTLHWTARALPTRCENLNDSHQQHKTLHTILRHAPIFSSG